MTARAVVAMEINLSKFRTSTTILLGMTSCRTKDVFSLRETQSFPNCVLLPLRKILLKFDAHICNGNPAIFFHLVLTLCRTAVGAASLPLQGDTAAGQCVLWRWSCVQVSSQCLFARAHTAVRRCWAPSHTAAPSTETGGGWVQTEGEPDKSVKTCCTGDKLRCVSPVFESARCVPLGC